MVLIAAPVVVFAVGGLRRIRAAGEELVRAQAMTPYALYAAALATAVIAVILAFCTLFTRNDARLAARRAGAIASIALIASIVVSGIAVRYASSLRWQPLATSAVSAIEKVPSTLGEERYQISMGLSGRDDVHAAGNGVVLHGWSSVVGYDGPTGRTRWEVDGLRSLHSSATTWLSSGDRSGLVVFAKDRSLVALDAGTGDVRWARLMRDEVDFVVGGVGALGVTLEHTSTDRTFLSLDPSDGRTLWSGQDLVQRSAAEGQFYVGSSDGQVIDARTGRRVANVSGRVLTDDTYLAVDLLTVTDRAGRTIDTVPREIFDGARSHHIEASNAGKILFSIWTDHGPRLYLRDTRSGTEVPLPAPPSGEWRGGNWIGENLLLIAKATNPNPRPPGGPSEQRMLFDLVSGTLTPSEASPCGSYESPGDYLAVAGAVLAFCGSSPSETLVGLA
ncbi:PQQ-binding-like beta-propeller repeat protein [Tsukamurella sp. DT100]|uniref:outer membrane protein assembly factor BamB family protein n=1 Tax=Tsukamurella sp. DT100 TaxID=3393415 RepID=UPI003CEF8704